VVRLIAQPPADLPPGEYWTRLIASARGAAQPVATADSNVAAQITLVVNTVISVTYRNGDVQTGLRLETFSAESGADSLVVRLGLRREGNAAWLGTAWVRLRDEAGRAVQEWQTPMAVYFTQDRRLAFPTDGLPRGRYVAEVELNTRREDIGAAYILPAAPVARSVPVELR
jgi:hypothetical protein